jgi:DraK-like histidine kinase
VHRRILQSTLFVVAITALVLGGPLAVTTWQLVEDFARADLTSRLEQVAARLDGPGTVDEVDTAALELAVPAGGQLTVEQAGRPTIVLGATDLGPSPVVEALPLGPGFRITLAQPQAVVRTEQVQLTLIVVLLVVASVATGTVVATVTARRLAEPLCGVADRAARRRSVTASPSSTASPRCSTPRRAPSPSWCSASARWWGTSHTSCAAG